MSGRSHLSPFVLTAQQFDGLARGYGDDEAVGILVDGQAAKRRLLLRVLVDKIAEGLPGATRAAGSALKTLAAAEEHHPAAVSWVLAAPQVAAWALHHLGLLTAPAADRGPVIDELTLLAAAAACRAGVSFQLSVVSADGRLVLPTLGAVTRLGAGPVRLAGNGSVLSCAGTEAAVQIDVLRGEEAPMWLPLRQLGDGGEVPAAAIDDLDPYRDAYHRPPTGRLSRTEADELRQVWRKAWLLLGRECPQHASALRLIIRTVVPLVPQGDEVISGASRQAFGAIAISLTDNAAAMAETLVHEAQHLKLGAMLDLVDMYESGSGPRHYAPWRRDARSVGPLLQGCYAHLGVLEFWRRHRLFQTDLSRTLSDFEFCLWQMLVADGIGAVKQSGELTELGVRFTAGMQETVFDSGEDVVQAAIAEIVRDVVLAYRVRWRIVNRTAARQSASAMGSRCVLGQPFAAPSEMSSFTSDVPPGGGPRLADAARHWLVGTLSGNEPDADLLCGRYEEAVDRYEEAIRLTDDPDAWAGLAVAMGRLADPGAEVVAEHAELARAIFWEVNSMDASPQKAMGPRAVIQWMGL
ncbi:hypothetical protein Rhe02_50260 [Rhizocola hellebori]|uniref:HEXXH motif domain-containing protein n=1 Tax=Rhizocola hellebori TaxID=1392758 RepID=A0A8J3QA58_9ACTN|nr:HEXXH motif-containing putative peptide modification protein [Rhizocola hellebori]GIH06959.1 hypothetical protein Rhe02_50260 [Rhizocola hellebori]